MKLLAACRLYTFVDTSYLRGRTPKLVAQQLCDGGSDLIQLRAKNLPYDEIRRMAEAILPITRRAKVGFVINDHLALAQEIGADLCHMGQEDFFDAGHVHVCQLRTPPRAGATLRLGLSTHTPAQARRALDAGPDYIAIGPVYATPTKPNAKPVTLEYVRWAAANVKIPWFAIGGINLKTIDEVVAAGAKRVCIVSAILNADDVAKACKEFKRRLR
ncbi:MAG TPA: thiamine phosphate synthase [Verrucomicrobiae bacterium]|jgi:thiamine-phosphate pyrophosphorylase